MARTPAVGRLALAFVSALWTIQTGGAAPALPPSPPLANPGAVPFYAVDLADRPVDDLRRGEIELRVDGRPIEPGLFSAPGRGEDTAGARPARSVFLLFDLVFSTPAGLAEARHAAAELLDRLPSSDRLYLLLYQSGKGFREESGPVALDGAGRAALQARIAGLEPVTERVEAADLYCGAAHDLADSLATLAAFLQQLKGPKVLLYFSQGIDSRLYLEGDRATGGAKSHGGRSDPLGRRFEEPLAAIGRTGALPVFVDAQPAPAEREPAAGFGLEASSELESHAASRGDTALRVMSERAGGLLLRQGGARSLVDRLAGWTSAYYEVGLRDQEGQEGRTAGGPLGPGRLTLNVRRPGVKVWAPKGVRIPRDYRSLSDDERRFLMVDLVLAGSRGEASQQLAVTGLYRLDGRFERSAAGEAKSLRFQIHWPRLPRLTALDLYNVVVERPSDSAPGKVVVYDRSLLTPMSAHATLDVSLPASGAYIWGIVAVEPTRGSLYLRRLLVRSPPEAAAK